MSHNTFSFSSPPKLQQFIYSIIVNGGELEDLFLAPSAIQTYLFGKMTPMIYTPLARQ